LRRLALRGLALRRLLRGRLPVGLVLPRRDPVEQRHGQHGGDRREGERLEVGALQGNGSWFWKMPPGPVRSCGHENRTGWFRQVQL
jgi:hypothetical protein